MIKIITDNKLFNISIDTLNNHPNSKLFKQFYGSIKCDKIFKKENDITVDADPNSFVHIVSHMRYPLVKLNITDENLLEKIYLDAVFFGFENLALQINSTKNNTSTENAIIYDKVDRRNNKTSENIEQELKELDNSHFDDLIEIFGGNIEALKKDYDETKIQFDNINESHASYSSESCENQLNTSVIEQNDREKSQELINTIENKLLTSEALHVIETLSTDKNLMNIIKQFHQPNDTNSDTDSFDLNTDSFDLNMNAGNQHFDADNLSQDLNSDSSDINVNNQNSKLINLSQDFNIDNLSQDFNTYSSDINVNVDNFSQDLNTNSSDIDMAERTYTPEQIILDPLNNLNTSNNSDQQLYLSSYETKDDEIISKKKKKIGARYIKII
jgi:hypothetical protein